MEKIALIAESFISKKLLKTLEDKNVPTYSTIDLDANLNKISREEAINILSEEGDKIIYTNAEDVLPIVIQSKGNEDIKEATLLFKDKVFLKKLLQKIEGDSYFEEINESELDSFIPPENKDLIIKPVIGFLSLGIRKFNGKDEWLKTKEEVKKELLESKGMFDTYVLKSDRFLIEEYFEGDEYACDGYYDVNGEPVVLFVTKHIFKDKEDTRDVVYYSDPEMMAEFVPRITKFMKEVTKGKNIKRFPFHFEFRLKNDNIKVIEINPMRFGGFGLADLNEYAYGVNSYAHYLDQKKPDWDAILPSRKGKVYAFVLGRVPIESKGKEPDYGKFEATFKNILISRIVDHNKYPVFCSILAEADSLDDFKKYLTIDFNQFFKS